MWMKGAEEQGNMYVHIYIHRDGHPQQLTTGFLTRIDPALREFLFSYFFFVGGVKLCNVFPLWPLTFLGREH